MYSLVTALETVFREIGGVVYTETPALRVEVLRRRVRGVRVGGTGGRELPRSFLPADIVVSNADPGHTYGRLLGHVRRRRWTDDRLARLHQSMSCFLLYLGVRRRYPQLTHHTIIAGPRYEGLVRDIFDRKTLAGDFSMYLHTPSRTDPSMAPPGRESMYVLVPVPNAASGIDWAIEAPRMTLRVLDALEAWGLEGLTAAVEVREVFTPDDFTTQFGAVLGNAFGIEPQADPDRVVPAAQPERRGRRAVSRGSRNPSRRWRARCSALGRQRPVTPSRRTSGWDSGRPAPRASGHRLAGGNRKQKALHRDAGCVPRQRLGVGARARSELPAEVPRP